MSKEFKVFSSILVMTVTKDSTTLFIESPHLETSAAEDAKIELIDIWHATEVDYRKGLRIESYSELEPISTPIMVWVATWEHGISNPPVYIPKDKILIR